MTTEKLEHYSNITLEEFDNLEKDVYRTIEGHECYILRQKIKLYGLTHYPIPKGKIDVMYRGQKKWRSCDLFMGDYGLETHNDSSFRTICPGLKIRIGDDIYCIDASKPFMNRGTLYGLRLIN